MEYREMGGSGFKVPVLSLGTGTDYIDLYRVVDALNEFARETGHVRAARSR
jgi:hypothetical protein